MWKSSTSPRVLNPDPAQADLNPDCPGGQAIDECKGHVGDECPAASLTTSCETPLVMLHRRRRWGRRATKGHYSAVGFQEYSVRCSYYSSSIVHLVRECPNLRAEKVMSMKR